MGINKLEITGLFPGRMRRMLEDISLDLTSWKRCACDADSLFCCGYAAEKWELMKMENWWICVKDFLNRTNGKNWKI